MPKLRRLPHTMTAHEKGTYLALRSQGRLSKLEPTGCIAISQMKGKEVDSRQREQSL